MSVFISLLLGLVQGITEFLPISSSGHLSILQNLLNLPYTEDEHLLFTILLHLGTLVSICVVYWDDLRTMVSDGLEFLRTRADSDKGEPIMMKPPARTILFVIIGTIPLVLTLFFMNGVKRLFMSTGFIGFALIATGGLLFVSERFIERGNKTEKTMTIVDALIIGLAQAVAVLPGLSRSGTTIVVGLSRGLSGSFAVRFSLLLAIPAIIGATLVEIFKAIRDGMNFSLLPIYLAGFAVAAVTGYFAIQIIRRLVAKGGFGKVAYYCWGIGALAIILSLIQQGS